MKNRIAVVELGDSHEECLAATLWFLSEEYEVDLYINEVPWKRVTELQEYCRAVHVVESRAGIVRIGKSLDLAIKLHRERYHAIFLNTAQGRIKFLCLFSLFNRSRFIGLLHNVHKLQKGLGQQLISHKVDQYLVLNDYLLAKARACTTIPAATYYPIFFPPQPSDPAVDKPPGEVWITVPGRVENKRRDYAYLLTLAQKLKDYPHYKFIILGNMQATADGRALAVQIDSAALSQRFISFDSFVPTPTFNAYIQASDMLLPLISPRVTDFDKYLSYKITGSWNMAFAFRKPMLVDPAFMQHADFKENAVPLEETLSTTQLVEQIQACLKKDCYTDPKWNLAVQKERFLQHFKKN